MVTSRRQTCDENVMKYLNHAKRFHTCIGLNTNTFAQGIAKNDYKEISLILMFQ